MHRVSNFFTGSEWQDTIRELNVTRRLVGEQEFKKGMRMTTIFAAVLAVLQFLNIFFFALRQYFVNEPDIRLVWFFITLAINIFFCEAGEMTFYCLFGLKVVNVMMKIRHIKRIVGNQEISVTTASRWVYRNTY